MGIEFALPWALALLPAVPLVIWLWRRAPRPALMWPGAGDLDVLRSRTPTVVTTALVAGALTCGVVALAGPRRPVPGASLETEGINLLLVVDVSGSMAESDFDWNGESVSRLTAVKRAAAEFIAGRPQDRVGLILFAALPETASPLTADHAAVFQVLNAAAPRGIPTESETNLGDAIAWGLARLRGAVGQSAVVVLSDGEHNVSAPALTPRQAGQLAAAASVPVFTVFAGPPNGPGSTGMQALAQITGGVEFRAADAQQLDNAMTAIDRLTRNRFNDPRRRRFHEAAGGLAAAAASLLLITAALNRGPWLTLP